MPRLWKNELKSDEISDRENQSITHIIAPPDGRLIATANSTAVSRAGTVGRPTVDASQVIHALSNALGGALGPTAATKE